ncbi:MAG: nucleotidyltransferase domain-containing protein [Bacteroidota bacterium]
MTETKEIVIRPQDLRITQQIINMVFPAGVKVWVFGSRAKGTTKRFADLDLAFDANRPMTRSEVMAMQDQFEISDLPYTVDILDLHTVKDYFKAIIEKDFIPLPLS